MSEVQTLDILNYAGRAKPIRYRVLAQGCHEVVSHHRNRSGHVRVTSKGHSRIQRMIHRLVWEHYNGNIPPGKCVMHTCDNPACVNIKHLTLGTVEENNRDRASKLRSARGERNGRARLTEDQVKEIIINKGSLDISRLSDKYQVSHSTIKRIKNGSTWRHVVVTPNNVSP